MLDDLTHPGTGLRGLAVQAAPRLIGLASHGKPQPEMAATRPLKDSSGAHHVHG